MQAYENTAFLGTGWISLFYVYAQVREGFLSLFRVKFAVSGQPGKSSRGDGFGIDLKMTPQVLAVVTSPEPVSAQRDQAGTQPGSKLVRNHLHVIGGSDDWPVNLFQN